MLTSIGFAHMASAYQSDHYIWSESSGQSGWGITTRKHPSFPERWHWLRKLEWFTGMVASPVNYKASMGGSRTQRSQKCRFRFRYRSRVPYWVGVYRPLGNPIKWVSYVHADSNRISSLSIISEIGDAAWGNEARSPGTSQRSSSHRNDSPRMGDHHSILSNGSRSSVGRAANGSHTPQIPPRGLTLRDYRDYLDARVLFPHSPPLCHSTQDRQLEMNPRLRV